MTRRQFQRRMQELRASLLWDCMGGPWTCIQVKYYVSEEAMHDYASVMTNNPAEPLTGFAFEIFGSEQIAKQMRVLAILFWEQHVLTNKTYKEWL